MFIPVGFEQKSIVTSQGRMVYYTNEKAPWNTETNNTNHLPTLVFFHGFGGGSSAYEWSKVYPSFASEYRILAPDLVGWGRSEHQALDYKVEDYITTIIEFLEQTCQGPTRVIASSLTAAIMVRVAIAHPELFKSLILTTPAGLSDFGENYTQSFFAQLVSTPILDRFIYSAGVATAGGIRSFLETRQFGNPSLIFDEIVEAYLESATQPNAEYAALSFVRGDLCFDLSLYMNQLTIPTAIIWGEKSEFTGPEIGQRLADLNRQAVRIFQILDGVGLTPQLEVPAVTIGLIKKLLKQLDEVSISVV
ncbi:MAG: alpha/beta hydrolase [Trichodesmium sp. MAG_R04]|nr:alpha/beta hydrolase [Trichodesmium sp. MAG_R04]